MERSDEREAEQRALQVAAAAGGAALGAGVELLIGDAGAVVAATAAAQVLQHGLERLAGLRRRQAEAMLEFTAEVAGWSLDELLERITTDHHRLQLFGAAVRAVTETALEAKIQVVGRALATGALAGDDAVVDQQRFLVDLLADLEAPHVRVLAQLSQPHPRGRTLEVPRGPGEHPGWAVDDLEEALASDRTVVEPILRMLEARGLATAVVDAVGSAHNACAITHAGLSCLELLTERGSEAPPAG